MPDRDSLLTGHDHAHCIEAALGRAARLCERRGARLTPLRRRVLELIWCGHSAVKAYDLLRELGAPHGSGKPPTVYRALEFLIEQGLVHRLQSVNAYVGCPNPDARHEAHFLICDGCGEVSEFQAPEVRAAISDQAADLGFSIAQQMIEARGTCQSCRHGPG